MKCAIMQPTYLPWLGFFDLIRSVDIFVIYDHVQFEKQSWQQRNRIRNKSGEIMFTIPVLREEGLQSRIKDIQIDHKRHPLIKHLKTIQQSYSRAINFDLFLKDVEAIYIKQHVLLLELNMDFIRLGMKIFDIKTKVVFSSELDVQGQKVEALIDVCKKLQISHYYSPIGSKAYIDENNLFEKNNITLTYQNFKHPVYRQMNYTDFISHLSFIDYLFNSNNYTVFNTTNE